MESGVNRVIASTTYVAYVCYSIRSGYKDKKLVIGVYLILD